MGGGMIAETIFVLAAFCIGCVSASIYFWNRQQHLLQNLQDMLEDAVSGKLGEKHLDETKLSLIENSMWRFLCDCRMAYEQIEKQKKRIQILLSDISHQTLTPVSNLMLYSQLLEETLSELSVQPEGVSEEVRAIQEETEKLDFLIQSLVKLSRMEQGIISVYPRKQKIGDVLWEVKTAFSKKADGKQIALEVSVSEETAVFDLKWTVEAVGNIVDNAIKYTPYGGKVSVNIIAYPMFLCIRVSDNGIGIAEEEQAKIFTRFYRSAAVKEQQGVGIGLYLAREIIREQNGYVKVESELGKGSVFSVFLLRDGEKKELSQN